MRETEDPKTSERVWPEQLKGKLPLIEIFRLQGGEWIYLRIGGFQGSALDMLTLSYLNTHRQNYK
jgi:hypothetical protein